MLPFSYSSSYSSPGMRVARSGPCLSSAKLRSTDSVNPRAVLSRVRPRYRLYSKHRDRRCWTGPGIGIRVSFRTLEGTQLFRTAKEQESAVGSRPPHLNVALSKAALSGPSLCLRARAPCPLRVTCLRIVLPDRGVQQRLQACVPVAPWDKTLPIRNPLRVTGPLPLMSYDL